jgi:hypothetical protein
MTKNGLGHILGDFFAYSSGHPGGRLTKKIKGKKNLTALWRKLKGSLKVRLKGQP